MSSVQTKYQLGFVLHGLDAEISTTLARDDCVPLLQHHVLGRAAQHLAGPTAVARYRPTGRRRARLADGSDSERQRLISVCYAGRHAPSTTNLKLMVRPAIEDARRTIEEVLRY